MNKHFENYSLDELQTERDRITPIIDLLSRAWDRPDLNASMAISWQIDDSEFCTRIMEIRTLPDQNVLRQFIHNFCTNLCAQKLVIKTLISQKS